MKSLINDEGRRGITSSTVSGLPNSTDQPSPSTLTVNGLELIDVGRASGRSLLHNEM
jgi:hypothetical protein